MTPLTSQIREILLDVYCEDGRSKTYVLNKALKDILTLFEKEIAEKNEYYCRWVKSEQDIKALELQLAKLKEVCICAAVKLGNGEIYRGHRHGDCILGIEREHKEKPISWKGHMQGFITSKNRFVCREEGRKLQDAAGIKSADAEGYRGNTLFSEDLY